MFEKIHQIKLKKLFHDEALRNKSFDRLLEIEKNVGCFEEKFSTGYQGVHRVFARAPRRFLFMPAILRHDGAPSCFYGHPSGCRSPVQPSFYPHADTNPLAFYLGNSCPVFVVHRASSKELRIPTVSHYGSANGSPLFYSPLIRRSVLITF